MTLSIHHKRYGIQYLFLFLSCFNVFSFPPAPWFADLPGFSGLLSLAVAKKSVMQDFLERAGLDRKKSVMVPAPCWPLLGANACRFAGRLMDSHPGFSNEAAAKIRFRQPILDRPICTRSSSDKQGMSCKLSPACTDI